MKRWLLDTGPLVAYLDARDPAHIPVTTTLDDFVGQLCTTSAVITEAMHLVTGHPDGPDLVARFANASGLAVYDYTQPAELLRAAPLMRKYADTPMDFADATLLLLADGLKIVEIATLDRRGFSTYRTPRGTALRLVIESPGS